jgi:DNA processing protein
MDLRAAVALSLVEGVYRSRVAACLREASAEQPGLDSAALVALTLGRLALPRDGFTEANRRAGEALDEARRAGLEALAWRDARYPRLLAEIHDPPPVLWLRGDPAALAAPAVALVGARAASAAAIETARTLAAALARRGVAVVSGLARGVDSAAHKGALDAGGVTVAVLGSGADRIYPPEHERLARDIAARGAVVSELAPGAPPLPEHFPARNRIISGLARAVVVVQAAERSGSLITARCALEQGRDVMAVPGLVLGGRNHGAHALIKDGAKLVETVDDILEELPGLGQPERSDEGPDKYLLEEGLANAMPVGEPCTLDELAMRTGLAAGVLLGRLLELELDGRVARSPGGRFVRAARRMVT